jgi:predicted dehydrogenase
MSDFVWPKPRDPDPGVAPELRWGVLGPGGIAHAWSAAVLRYTRQTIVAVASRDLGRAEVFGGEFAIPRAYGSYEELVADPDIQAVYVASPHSHHLEHALLAIRAGKHVLVEKPMTRNQSEAAELFAAADAEGVLAMEGMWARFLPHMDVVRQVLERGELGELTTIMADHGQFLPSGPDTRRIYELELAGGALLDLGVYPISFSLMLTSGRAELRSGYSTIYETGVDVQTSALLSAGDVHSVLTCTCVAATPTTAVVAGTAGRLQIAGPFYMPAPLTLVRPGGEQFTRPVDDIQGHEGLCFEAAHFAQLVADGRRDSPVLPRADTLEALRIMDSLRAHGGVEYPGEARLL